MFVLVPYIPTYDLLMGTRESSGELVTDKDIEKTIECYEEIVREYCHDLDKAKEYTERLYDKTQDDRVFIRLNSALERSK